MDFHRNPKAVRPEVTIKATEGQRAHPAEIVW